MQIRYAALQLVMNYVPDAQSLSVIVRRTHARFCSPTVQGTAHVCSLRIIARRLQTYAQTQLRPYLRQWISLRPTLLL